MLVELQGLVLALEEVDSPGQEEREVEGLGESMEWVA